jgi:RAS protein activator-like 1
MPYLHSILGPIVDQIYVEDKYCELDPIKIEKKEKQVLAASESLLTGYLMSILDCVLSSSAQCPPLMKEFFSILYTRVKERFPDNADLPYLAVSSFIFLRFFAAALLSPKLFGLRRDHPNVRVSRTLTLGAKTLQSIGNLVECLGKTKEAYMVPLHPLIRNHVPKLKQFIDKLVEVDDVPGE